MSLTIISWNVNGIRAAAKKGFTTFLTKQKPDILGIQEVKISNESREKEVFDFVGYSEHWNSAERPGYSGTMTLVNEQKAASLKVLSHEVGIGNKEFDFEGRVHTLEFPKFYFINIYFPNAKADLSRIPFKQEFNAMVLKKIKKLEKKKPVIVVGDYNVAHNEIDLARPDSNHKTHGFTKEERADMTTFLKNGLVDTFRTLHPEKVQYSWWSPMAGARTRNVGWRIDYVLVSKSLQKKVKSAFILDQVHGSDHCPVGIEIDL
jgi:exodeoxyribonuclease-3